MHGGDLASISPDGERIVYYDGCLHVHSILLNGVESTCRYTDITEVVMIKFISNDYYVVLTNDGLYLYSYSSIDHFQLMTNYANGIYPKLIVDVQVDIDSGYYLIQQDSDDGGIMQYGNYLKKEWTLIEGMCGNFVRASNCLFSGLFLSYLYRCDNDNRSKYAMITKMLDNHNSSIIVHEVGCIFNDEGRKDYPRWMVIDPISLIAYIGTRVGYLEIWDIMNCCSIDKAFLISTAIFSVVLHPEGGFIGLCENENLVFRCKINKEELIEEYAKVSNSRWHYALFLAARWNLHDTQSVLVRNLITSLFADDMLTSRSAIKDLFPMMRLIDEQRSARLCESNLSIIKLTAFLYHTWSHKHGINWIEEIQWWFNKACMDTVYVGKLSPVICDYECVVMIYSDEISDLESCYIGFVNGVLLNAKYANREGDIGFVIKCVEQISDELIQDRIKAYCRITYCQIFYICPQAIVLSDDNLEHSFQDIIDFFLSSGYSIDDPYVMFSFDSICDDMKDGTAIKEIFRKYLSKEIEKRNASTYSVKPLISPTPVTLFDNKMNIEDNKIKTLVHQFLKEGINPSSVEGRSILEKSYPDVYIRAKMAIVIKDLIKDNCDMTQKMNCDIKDVKENILVNYIEKKLK